MTPAPASSRPDRFGQLRACHPGDRLLAAADEEHRGGRLGLYRITVVRLPDQELVAVAEGQVTIPR